MILMRYMAAVRRVISVDLLLIWHIVQILFYQFNTFFTVYFILFLLIN